jgi:protein-disulfide isomerase
MQRLSFSAVSEPGNTWPDQFEEKAQASLETAWTLDLAERCKVEGTTTFVVPSEPFASEAELKAWLDAQLDEVADPNVKKPIRMEYEPLNL